MKWKTPKDVPLEELQRIVFEVSEKESVHGRETFCGSKDHCISLTISRLGPDAAHFHRGEFRQHLQNLGKTGNLRFNQSSNNGARSYIERESEQSKEYIEWISSDSFRRLSDICKEHAEWRCQICNVGKGKVLEAHHRTYERMKTPNEIHDLICLCRRCHTFYHDKIKDLPDELF